MGERTKLSRCTYYSKGFIPAACDPDAALRMIHSQFTSVTYPHRNIGSRDSSLYKLRLWVGRPGFDSWQRQWRSMSLRYRIQTSLLSNGCTGGTFSGGKTVRAWSWPLTSI